MRKTLRFIIVTWLVLGNFATLPINVSAANLDNTADRVFGQPDFTSNTLNNGGVSPNSLYGPQETALDAQGNLYVADSGNNRVLEYHFPLSNGMPASLVIGQSGSFTTTLANKGGVSARSLNFPTGVALDAAGNLFVADNANNRVLEYDLPLTTDTTADRVFGQTTFATNTPNQPNQGGVTADGLFAPYAVALDTTGNLYVADLYNNRALEYDSPLTTDKTADRVFGQSGIFTTNTGGVGADSLSGPRGLALDAQGDLYVADSGNNRVLEYNSPPPTNTTADFVFGQPDFNSNTQNSGGLSANSLWFPTGVAVDAQGDLYAVDNGNHRVLEYNTPLSTDAAADRVIGQPDFTSNTLNNGGLDAKGLNGPIGVTVDAQGNLYIADYANNRVLEYDVPVPYGAPALIALSPYTLAAGGPAFTLTVNGIGFVLGSIVRWNGGDRPTTFLNSTRLNAALSAADVAAGGPFAVTVFTPAPGGGTSGLINLPLYLRNEQDFAADGVLGQPGFGVLGQLGFPDNLPNNILLPGGANRLNAPEGVAVDQHSGRLFVVDSKNQRVLSWPNGPAFANGQAADLVLGQPDFNANIINNGGLSAKSLDYPYDAAIDNQGNLYVSDSGNNRVLVYTAPLSNGMAANHVFGQGGSFTTAVQNNGGVSANSLNEPLGLAIDAKGNLYVTDYFNQRVLEYNNPLTTDTTADRVFGQAGSFTSDLLNNGGLSANSLNRLSGVAVDAKGNLYVADTDNQRVLEYDTPLTTDTTADRVFGQGGSFTTNTPNNGGVSAKSLNSPLGVTLDARGDLYVVDTSNYRVLEYNNPLTTDTTADRVFGQPDFTTNTGSTNSPTANNLQLPYDAAMDAYGNLYVADTSNNRVLEYDLPPLKVLLPLIRR